MCPDTIRGNMDSQDLLVLILTITNRLISVYCFCDKRFFVEAGGKYYKEKIAFGPTATPVLVDDCKRACKLDVKCFAYQILWTDDKRGYCETVHKIKADFSTIQANSSYTVFGK